MHILHVLDHSIPIQDGYSYRTLAILAAQRAMGWQTSHLTGGKQGETGSASEELEGLVFHRTPPPTGLGAGLPLYPHWAIIKGLEARLETLVAELAPDVIHAHSPALNGVAAVRVGRRHGIPVVYEVRGFWEDAAVDLGTGTEWGMRYRLTRALETWVMRNANHVTTICEGLRAEIQGRGIDPSRLTVIPNGADPDEFLPRAPADPALVAELGLQDATVVGYIGSFYAYEGLPLIVRAMAQLKNTRSDVKALLVGGGIEYERVRALVAELGVQDRVVLTGRVPHAEVFRYYDLLDVMVYPRVSMRLTELVTPLKPLEAMARGQLVIASDVGGHRELVRHGENGYLFRPDDAGELASTIAELLERRAEWPALEQAGKAYVRDERNWASSVARYQGVYGPLLAGARP